MPRDGSVTIINVAGNSAYQLTATGLQQLRELAEVGTPIKRIADFFDVSEDWMRKAIEGDPLVRDAYKSANGNGEFEIRRALHTHAVAGDSRVLTFVAERRLKMNKEVEVNVNHTHKVIGAVPDYRAPPEQWLERFRPAELAAPVEDAEFSEVGDDSGKAVASGAEPSSAGDVRDEAGG